MLQIKRFFILISMTFFISILFSQSAHSENTEYDTFLGPEIEISSFSDWPEGFSNSAAYFGEAVLDNRSQIWMIPQETNQVVKLNTVTGEMTGYDNWPDGFVKSNGAFSGGVFDDESIWMIPSNADQLIKLNVETEEMTSYEWPVGFFNSSEGETKPYFNKGVFDGEYVWLAPSMANKVIKVEPTSGEMTEYENWPEGFTKGPLAFNGAVYDGQSIWFIPSLADQIIKLDPDTGEMTGYNDWPDGFNKSGYAFAKGLFDGEYIWMLPSSGANMIIKLDPNTGEMTGYNDWPSGHNHDENPNLSLGAYDGRYIWTKYGSNRFYRIDTHTGEIEDFDKPNNYNGRYSAVFDGLNIWMIPFGTVSGAAAEVFRLSSVPIMHPAHIENGEVSLSWTPVNGATEYSIYESEVHAVGGTEIATVSDSFYTVTNLPINTAHYFTVKAVFPSRVSTASNEISVTVLPYNTSLSSLNISEGELSPQFDQDIYEYSASVAYEMNEITVTASTVDPDSTMTVNGVTADEVDSIPLTVGENVIEIEVIAPAGNQQTYTVLVTRAASPEARLSSITLSEGELSPKFDWDIYQYRADVDHEVEEIMVTSAAVDSDSTMSINGVESDGGSELIPLSVGENVIEIEVTAPAGNEQTYTVLVTRAASPEARLSSFSLSEGELSPQFDQDIYAYSASVAYEMNEITVTASTVDPDSTLSINGVTADEVDSIPLTVGENVIEIEVTAPAGNQQTYTVSITRAASPEARLSSITLSEGELSPEFDWDIYQYRADVDHEVEEIMVTSAAVDSDSTMSINGVESDGENVSTPLSVGENVIEIEVTAPAANQQTYSVTITRATSAEASLSSLTLSEGELSPEFNIDIYQYRADVDHEVEEITVTAATVDPNSTITVNGVNADEVDTIPLTVGENEIEIEVTAPAGNQQTYTIFVNRVANEGSAPLAPVLEVEEIFETSIELSWTEVEHAEIYQLSRDGEIVYVGEHTTFVDKELIANTEYTYTIVARNTFGSSPEYSLTIFTSEEDEPVDDDQKDEEEFEEEQQITEPSKPIKEDNEKEDKKDEENMEDEKNKLPLTASTTYHYMLLGIFTITLGILLFIIYRRYHAKPND
ncbi:hypothetical protein BTS2_3269 [Bacillus sp. TS-2]|nr:hypothetical protein BTS2_3269 [Bacillus sp. TS-2]